MLHAKGIEDLTKKAAASYETAALLI